MSDFHKEQNYRTFSVVPEYNVAQWKDGKLLNEGVPTYKWSGKKSPPAVGENVHIYMNNFGDGTIMGYFVEYGWLGILVRIHNPPEWWVVQMQERGKDPYTTNGHFFGCDLDPLEKKRS